MMVICYSILKKNRYLFLGLNRRQLLQKLQKRKVLIHLLNFLVTNLAKRLREEGKQADLVLGN